MKYQHLKNLFGSAYGQIEIIKGNVIPHNYLSSIDIVRIKQGKQILKDYYKSQEWADKAKNSGMTDAEVKATSKLLCDNVDRTAIVINPLNYKRNSVGQSYGHATDSYPVPVVAFQHNADLDIILHELLHASEFNARTHYLKSWKFDPVYYDNIDPNAISGLKKMTAVEDELSWVAKDNIIPKYRVLGPEEYLSTDRQGKKNSDKGEYITENTELRARRIANRILNKLFPGQYSKQEYYYDYFTPEANKIIDEKIFATIPAIGIAGKSAYDMLGNNQSNNQNNQSNNQNIQY